MAGLLLVIRASLGFACVVSLLLAPELSRAASSKSKSKTGNAKARSSSARKPASAPRSTAVTKAAWLSQMEMNLPGLLCGEGEYFRQCFSVTKQQCRETVKTEVRECASTQRLPASIEPMGDGLDHGHRLGECLGKKYERTFIGKKKANRDCSETWKWSS